MKRLFISLLLILLTVTAQAQTGKSVSQSGFVTPGHTVEWITNGVVGDSGVAAGSPFPGPFTIDVNAGNSQYINFVGSGSYTAPDSNTFVASQQTLTMFTSSGAAVGTGGTGGVSSATLTISAMTSGAFMPGCTLSGTGISGSPAVSRYGTSHGGTGTLIMSAAQTVSGGATISCTGGGTYTAAGLVFDGAAPDNDAPLALPTWGGLTVNPGGAATYLNLTCNYAKSGSLCVDNGPGLRVWGDIMGGDYLYFGATSNSGNEVLQLGPRIWGAYASLTVITSGYVSGAGNDSAASHCGGVTTGQCGSAYIIIQPDDTNQNGQYLGAGSLFYAAHGSVSGAGNAHCFATRSGANADTCRIEINSTELFPFADAAYSLGDASHRFTTGWFSSTVSAAGGFIANGSTGLTQTCTVNQAKTLIFTLGILTGGSCNS